MKNKKITIKNYQKHAMRTCLPSAKNWSYAIHNYKAELFELLAKVESLYAKQIRDGYNFNMTEYLDKIKDELGDCYWQLALICKLRDEQFKWNYKHKIDGRSYDWVFSMDLESKLSDVWVEFGRIDLIVRMFDFDINEILQRNIDKLASRAERGVLKGSGDSR